MAKALYGHLGGQDVRTSVLFADNAALRTRVSLLTERVSELEQALVSATALADGRLVDLVEDTRSADLDLALREVTAPAHV
jgi:hypothetical protein